MKKTKIKKDLSNKIKEIGSGSKIRGITLISLVITIIVLLILAGVTVATLMGENGLLNKAKVAGEENRKAEAIEDVKLRIMEVQAEKDGNATLEDLVEYLENNTTNEYKITKVSGGTASLVEGSIEVSEVGNAEKIYITNVKYGYEVEVNSNLTVTERVVASSGGSSSGSGSGVGEVTGGVSQEAYDSLSAEYENFRKAIAQSIKDAGGTETSYNANATTFDTNIKGILTEVTKDATATKDEILNGYTAYNNGTKVTGEKTALTKVLLESNVSSLGSKTTSAKNIPNYQSLTKDNFIVELIQYDYRDGYSSYVDTDMEMKTTYNQSTGDFSCEPLYSSWTSDNKIFRIYVRYNIYCIY